MQGLVNPQARLTTLISSDPNHIAFPLPFPPTSCAGEECCFELNRDAQSEPALLQAIASALLSADVSNVTLKQAEAPFIPQPGTLEEAVLHLNHEVFAHVARPRLHPREHGAQQDAGKAAGQQHEQPRLPPVARALPEAAPQGPPAGKRRKRTLSTNEEFVSRAVDPQQILADVAAEVYGFQAKMATLQDGAISNDVHASSVRRHADNQRTQPIIPLEQLRSLHITLAAGKQAGILQQLEHEQLRRLLLLLLEHVKLGIDQPMGEHDKDTDVSTKAVGAALEAACCCMQLLAAPGLPNSLYLDELLTATVQMAKYQLQYNVLSMHDAHYRRLYRPSIAQDDDAQPVATKKRARVETSGSKVSGPLADVCTKLELLLSLLAQVIGQVLLEVELLLPLVRVALMCLSIDSLQLLQAEALALAVAVFRAYPEQRSTLMDEVMTTVLSKVHCSSVRGPLRLYQVTDASIKPLHIQMATALVMNFVQVSVQLPAVDAKPEFIKQAYVGAFCWSNKFWEGLFAQLAAAKATKSDGAADFKAVIDALLTDLLAVQMLPEWPAATILLRRFVKVLSGDKGLKHPDAAVKLAAVDFTGHLASKLCAEAVQAEQEAHQVQAVLDAALAANVAGDSQLPTGRAALQALDHLLLDYLAAVASTDSNSTGAASAIHFTCCRMLSDAIHTPNGGKDLSKEELEQLLVKHRQLQDSHPPSGAAGGSVLQLSRAQYVGLVRRWVVEGPLGAGRGTLIQWLVEAGSRSGPDPNPATVRTKVYKCLGCVVEADSRVLGLPNVAAAVRAALVDDSVAVKDATLELLAKLINTNPALAGEYFDVLVQASHDPGISVRKRAIKSLWDCCTCPGFSCSADAVIAVLQRAADRESSMRGLVTKICREMWFTDTSSFAGFADDDTTLSTNSNSRVARSPQVRAKELAEVSFRMYEARGKGIHVPLPADNPLVVILQEVLGVGSAAVNASGGRVGAPNAKELKDTADLCEGAAEVTGALLSMFLQLQQDQREGVEDQALANTCSSSSSHSQFSYLLALHALCTAEPGLATPAKDPQRFVRALAPYVGSAAPATTTLPRALSRQLSHTSSVGMAASEECSRYAADECVCLLAVLEAVLGHLEALEQGVLQQLSADVIQMLNSQRQPQLISAGCRLLCVIAPMHPAVVPQLSQLVTKCYNMALGCLSSRSSYEASPIKPAPRALYILGQLCRYGAHLLDQCAVENAGVRSCIECLEICVSLWHSSELSSTSDGQRVKDAALQAMGMIVIGKPNLMLQQLHLNLAMDAADQQLGGFANAASTADSAGSDHGSPPGPEQQQDEKLQQAQDPAPGIADALPGLQHLSAARVYAAALSGSEPLSVKTRVLTNLVELLRSEEAALVSRQKDIEVASATSRLASTLPTAGKRPLSRVNGESDATTSSSSSIIQNVWEDVLRLATGAPGQHAASACVLPVGGAGVNTLEAAATMRRKALELIEVVLRGGLVAPWSAIPPLVAQLTDTAPDTRQAAHRVLKTAADKYSDFVAGQLAPGVVEAYQFQSRLWAAKHPGQPLPKGPSAEVLEGLAAMYADIIHPDKNGATRQRFLSNLLKPFEASCNLANPSAAAREDIHKLAFCVYVAAALPFKRADEPLVLIHTINGHVSRQAHGVADTLKQQLVRLGLKQQLQLEEDMEDMDDTDLHTSQQQQDHHQQQQAESNSQAEVQQQQQQHGRNPELPQLLPQEVLAPVKASLALSMLLVLKQYLMAAYRLTDERVAAFELKGEVRRVEVKALVSKDKGLPDFGLGPINLRSLGDATGELLAELYKTFRGLLENDAVNYREAAVPSAGQEHDSDDADMEVGIHKASATPAAAAARLVVFSMDTKKARTKSHGKRGGRSTSRKAAGMDASTAKGKGGRRAASTGRLKAKKRRSQHDSDDNVDEDDEEWEGDGKRKLW